MLDHAVGRVLPLALRQVQKHPIAQEMNGKLVGPLSADREKRYGDFSNKPSHRRIARSEILHLLIQVCSTWSW